MDDGRKPQRPGAKDDLEDLKQDVAEDVGVPLEDDGDNGDLTARQLGKVGGTMVKRLVALGEERLDELRGQKDDR